MTIKTGLIWAEASGGVIGVAGKLPWHLPEDLAHFKRLTMGHPVIMGRKTWESLPEKFRPLPGRENLVVTRQYGWHAPGAHAVGSLEQAIRRIEDQAVTPEREEDAELGGIQAWIIGGGELFAEAIAQADRLEVTELDIVVVGDTQAPAKHGWRVIAADPFEAGSWHTATNGIRFRFVSYTR